MKFYSRFHDIYPTKKSFAILIFLYISTNNINAKMSTLYNNKEVNMNFQPFNFFLVKF